MSKIILILGGARSGKSSYAITTAKSYKKVAFIATAQALDREMCQRIKLHKKFRPQHWQTIEEPLHIDTALKKAGNRFNCLIVDCLTLLVSNLILSGASQGIIEAKINKMISSLKKHNSTSLIVSNEVGLGIVPNNKLARDFRDVAGKMNQLCAKKSDEVYFMVSGIPWRIK